MFKLYRNQRFGNGPQLIALWAFLCLFIVPARVLSQWLWVDQNANANSLYYLGIDSDDQNGDVYVTGFYCGTGPGASGIAYARRGAGGNVIYEKVFQPPTNTTCLGYGYDIAVTGNQLVIAGTYDNKPLLALFDRATGNHQANWLYTGTGQVHGMDYRNGKYYVIGNYLNTLDLGNGFSLPGSPTVNNVFVAVFDAGNGNCVAAVRLGASGIFYGYDIKADGAGNLFLSGFTNANVTFHAPSSGTYVHSGAPYSSFCAKLSPSLQLLWTSKTGVSNSVQEYNHEFPLALDAAATALYTGGLGLLQRLNPANGTIQASEPQNNKIMDDLAVSGCAVFTVGTTNGSPFLTGGGADNAVPCHNVPTLFYLTKNDLNDCSQVFIENSTNACANGFGIVINHLNDPVCCGRFDTNSPLELGGFSLTSFVYDRGIVAMFDDDCLPPGPCNPDVTPPTFSFCPPDQTVYVPCMANCGTATFAATATDNCALQSLTYNFASGFCFSLGTTTVAATATDVAGNINNSCSFDVTVECQSPCDPTNLCLDFDGTNDFVNVSNPLNTIALQNNFTVGCWFRDDRPTGPPDNFFYRVFGFAWMGPRFEVGEQNGFLSFYSNAVGLVFSSTTIRDGQWHYLAAVKNGGTATIYLDGAPVPGLSGLAVGSFSGAAQNFHIGDWAGLGSIPRFWQGRIDEFKVWGVALPQALIAEEMLCSEDVSNTSLLVHFPFDQNTSCGNNAGLTLAVNTGSSGQDGILTNFALAPGCQSNWVDRGRDRLPDCRVGAFTWLEGNVDRNLAGRTKVYDADIFTAGADIRNNVNYPVFVRRESDGTVVWRCLVRRQGYVSDFIRSDDGCFLLVGYGPNYSDIDNRSFIAAVDQNGALLWLHEYNLDQREAFTRILRNNNPSNPAFPYLVCGIRKSSGSFNDDVTLFAIDGSGTIGWMRRIGAGTGDDEFRLDLLNLGTAGGEVALAGNRGNNAVIFLADNTGTQLTTSLVYQAGVRFYDVERPAFGAGLLVAGSTPTGEGLLAKLNASGGQVWALRFPGLSAFRQIVVRPDGRIWALASRRPATPHRNVMIALQEASGGGAPTVLWQKHLERPGETAWGGSDLVWYSGDMLFYTDSRVNNPNGWGNEDVLAVMRQFDQDTCPVTLDSLPVLNFNLLPSTLPILNNPLVTPLPTPAVGGTWAALVLNRADPCKSSCECKFDKLTFSKKGTPLTGWSLTVEGCDNEPVTLPSCPGPYTPIYLTGLLKCIGDCEFGGLNWTLTAPNGTQYNGSSTTGSFSVPITLSMTQTAGTYELSLSGMCGGQVCTCVIRFVIGDCPPPCSCAEPAFTNAVNAGFSILQFLPGCQYRFKPQQLTDCDQVEWKVALAGTLNFTVFANTTGNLSATYNFPNSGQYVVCMTVTRSVPGGVFCTVSRCWVIDVNCDMLAPPDEASRIVESFCDLSVIVNDGFALGAGEGGFADGGHAASWDHAGGNPELVADPGQLDTNVVRLRGNSGFADLLYQDSLPVAAGQKIRISLALRPMAGQILPGTDLVVRLSAQVQNGVICDDSTACVEVVRVAVPDDLDGSQWLLASAYDSTTADWKYLTVHLENPFFDDDLAVKSGLDVDNVCLREFNFVDAGEPLRAMLDIRIFPNPNPGVFTAELPAPAAPGLRLRVISLTGQILFDKPAEPGLARQTVHAERLPAGLYFLQFVDEGRVLAAEKFVKE